MLAVLKVELTQFFKVIYDLYWKHNINNVSWQFLLYLFYFLKKKTTTVFFQTAKRSLQQFCVCLSSSHWPSALSQNKHARYSWLLLSKSCRFLKVLRLKQSTLLKYFRLSNDEPKYCALFFPPKFLNALLSLVFLLCFLRFFGPECPLFIETEIEGGERWAKTCDKGHLGQDSNQGRPHWVLKPLHMVVPL